MTKEPTKADLLKTIKKQDAAVRKLTKALNFEKGKLEASQAVAAAYLRTMQDAGVALDGQPAYKPHPDGYLPDDGRHREPHADQPSLPWDMPNPFGGQ